MEYHFCGCVKSDLDKIKYFVENRIEELNRYIDDVDKLYEIKLIVNELIINGAMHGNNFSVKKTVFLNIDLDGDMLFIKVKDEGAGFEFKMEDYDPSRMLSSGRGLVIVNGLADELEMGENVIQAMINI